MGTKLTSEEELTLEAMRLLRDFMASSDGVRSLTPRCRCIKNVRADVDGNLLTAKKGDMLEPNDDLVRIAPASFEAVNVPA